MTAFPTAPDALLFENLPAMAAELHGSPELAHSGRTARTLISAGPLRVTLIAVRAGGVISEHRAPGALAIHVVQGDVTLETGGAAHELHAGDLLAVPPHQQHAVTATTATTLLLLIVPTPPPG